MFYGKVFMYDGVSSDRYNLFIGSMDVSDRSDGSSNIEIYNEEIYRRWKPYFFGTRQTPVLEYDLEFFSENELNAWDAQAAQSWLFGKSQHKILQIRQPDIQSIYWNVLLTEPQVIRNGNYIIGFTCRAVCDSPFAYTYEKNITYTAPIGLGFNDERINFYNLSDNSYYLYPRIEIKLNDQLSYDGSVSITNVTESNRLFNFSEAIVNSLEVRLLPNEILTIDNDLQIITSSTGNKRLVNFNKNWLRLLQGKNVLNLTGDFDYLKLYYQFAKKMGG